RPSGRYARAVARLAGHAGAVSFAFFLPDGQTAVTGGEDRGIRLWNVGKTEERSTHRYGSGKRRAPRKALDRGNRQREHAFWLRRQYGDLTNKEALSCWRRRSP